MQLPFTVAQFYEVFQDYNEAVWPSQWGLLALAGIAVYLAARPRPWSHRALSAILAGLWLWQAIAYHFAFFATINPLAYLFAAISLVGALVFLWQGVLRGELRFGAARNGYHHLGWGLIVFALLVYPAWSWMAGHRYPATPTFGLPCPTTIFTIGMLALREAPYSRGPLIIPVLWCFVGGQAAFLLKVPQDLGLFAAGMIGIVLLMRRHRAALRQK